ncbi:MAG TPA: fasciclin domain-containing protein [Gemmatimonadaceae bacterium]
MDNHNGPGVRHEGESSMMNILQVAEEIGSFNALVAAVKAAGLAETLEGAGPFTVFAPPDGTFAKLPPGSIGALFADKEKLASILTYHVIAGKVGVSDIASSNGATPVTANGQELEITVRGGRVFVNNAQVVTSGIMASNGVIHVINGILMPKPEPAMSDH